MKHMNMWFIVKRFLKPRLDFRTALLLAILLHLLLFLLPESKALFIPLKELSPLRADKSDKIDFRFVEVPEDKSEPNPDSKIYSDQDRRASTPEPNPTTGASQDPISRGQTPEAMLSRVDPSTQPRQLQKQPEKSDVGPEKILEESEKADGWSKLETGNKEDLAKIQRDMLLRPKMPNLSREDLNKYFKFQDFDNKFSNIMRKGGIQFDTKGFDFGKWLSDFYYKVYSNWSIPLAFRAFRRSGTLTLKFYVHRDGSVSGLELIDSSGLEPYDDAAMNAIIASDPFLPLPEGYPDDKMEVKCRFMYIWSSHPDSGGWGSRR